MRITSDSFLELNASHRIASHRIASHRIASHRIASQSPSDPRSSDADGERGYFCGECWVVVLNACLNICGLGALAPVINHLPILQLVVPRYLNVKQQVLLAATKQPKRELTSCHHHHDRYSMAYGVSLIP
ncbi:hypothetical protein C8R48DRAFT_45189 [Suillus tomentosus]|nr:hypothetical protein C8R48DRAFT_45189 [Suillus tomentosus]